ncbi:hypothetical protein BDZ97DRAFT_1806073 [Flammula alnicola]|nr:hypothetical protein BDZ97DRAFT_1806073 [Flammula alnicola]
MPIPSPVVAAAAAIPAAIAAVNRLTLTHTESTSTDRRNPPRAARQSSRTTTSTTTLMASTSRRYDDDRRAELKSIGEETLHALKEGMYGFRGVDQPLENASHTHISVLHISTLDAARLLEQVYKNNPSEHGTTGRQNSLAYYSHAIIYSPKVTVFRDDDGAWTYPFDIDVLSCAAVNAGEVRKATNAPVSSGLEVGIEKEMNERMGRICTSSSNKASEPYARFKYSFDRVIFAITGEETFAEFQSAFDAWGQERAVGQGRRQNQNRGGYSSNLINL